MSNIHFCSECNNMSYIYTDEDKNIFYLCKTCSKRDEFENKDNCIYEYNFQGFDKSELINSNKYITHDNTLPKIENENIKCTNKECISIIENKKSSITYLKYDPDNMKYIYICNYCGQKWKNN